MNIGFIVLILGLIAGLTAGYTTRVMARSPEGMAYIQMRNLFVSILGAIAFPALLAVIVWGFIYLPWWWVVLSFFGVSLLIVPILFGGVQRLPFIIKVQPAMEIVVICSAAFLWTTVLW